MHSHLRKISVEWLPLLSKIGADLLQSRAVFIITNQNKGYFKSGTAIIITNRLRVITKPGRSIKSRGSYYKLG